MNRRAFLQRTTAAGAAIGATFPSGSPSAMQAVAQPPPAPGRPAAGGRTRFKLQYAPHFGMFEQSAGKDLVDQLTFMADQGFTALEDNGMMGRTPELQQQLGAAMSKLGIAMGVFVVQSGGNNSDRFTSGKPENRALFVKACEEAVAVAARVNATWMTVVPGGFERRLPIGLQTGHVIDTLRAGADVFAKHNLVMVLEPLSDNPDQFLRTSDQTYMICRGVNSPACKILFDIYHMQRNEGHIIPHIDLAWSEIAYFQIGDNPGRKEPTTGEVNYRNIFKHVHAKMQADGRDFIFGMEHGNLLAGKEGEQKVIEAYVASDAF
ncbi:MAG: hydroxypyruvate isomerase family protein [Luteitalea sp.]